MIVRIIECHFTKIPCLSEINECIELAKLINTIIKLKWFTKNSGWCEVFISNEDTAEEIYKTFESYQYQQA